jgi:hypothetical protein
LWWTSVPHTPAPERLTREGWLDILIGAPACIAMRPDQDILTIDQDNDVV